MAPATIAFSMRLCPNCGMISTRKLPHRLADGRWVCDGHDVELWDQQIRDMIQAQAPTLNLTRELVEQVKRLLGRR